jgi:hypothetical protein
MNTIAKIRNFSGLLFILVVAAGCASGGGHHPYHNRGHSSNGGLPIAESGPANSVGAGADNMKEVLNEAIKIKPDDADWDGPRTGSTKIDLKVDAKGGESGYVKVKGQNKWIIK